MGPKYRSIRCFLLATLLIGAGACTKLVQVAEPNNTITTTETFDNDISATSAITGIYNDIVTGGSGGGYGGMSFGNGLTTIDAGMSADELHQFNGVSLYETNALDASSDVSIFWNGAYYDIYLANAAIEGLQASSGVSAKAKRQLTGEAKFIRAFCYFYLVNLFGDVPLVLTTAYAQTDTASRSPAAQVYQQMTADLLDAQQSLPNDYSVSGGEKIRVNQAGVTALLARVYLYQQLWTKADSAATSVINTNVYKLVSDPDSVFLANSAEAILQWQIQSRYPYATSEGLNILPNPNDSFSYPQYTSTPQLLGSFEPGDLRKMDWIDSSYYLGAYYYFPYKYKIKVGTSGNIQEYYMVLRLAELYLIRAEARAQENPLNLPGAISDLNVIRERAKLNDLSPGLTQTQVLAAVMQERKIELFAEWGHRWMDLKRTGKAVSVLSTDKAFPVPAYQLLYPIPAGELKNDGNLIQNPQY